MALRGYAGLSVPMKKTLATDRVDALVADWHRENPALRTGAMQVVGRIIRLGRAYQDEVSAMLRPYGLSYSDFDVIATLRRAGPPYARTPTQLQQSVLLTSGAMTACLGRLERQSLISRSEDAEDRRRSKAALTQKGQDLVDQLISRRFALAENALVDLSGKQTDNLIALLRRLDPE
tara:strand:- start:597 stop:1127 length:531 start_codon:yes stop_codon:yes gene_type:complete